MIYNKELWNRLVSEGRKKDNKGIANKLDEDDLNTILSTMDFFGASDIWIRQTYYDLKIPKYRVFDWLAMCVMGRNDDKREQNNTALKVLVNAFIKAEYEPIRFIELLRTEDYEVNTEWETITIE